MTRKEAIEKDYKHYNGKPCISCGNTLKFVTSYGCVDCTTKRTKERDPEIYKKYIKSDKGQKWIKGFRNSTTYQNTQNRYNRKKYSYNPEWYQSKNLKSKYGITLEEYNVLLEKQNGVCYICKQTSDTKKLAVDHNHETGENRKLLCGKCNMALGLLNEDKDIMLQMIRYIEEHS